MLFPQVKYLEVDNDEKDSSRVVEDAAIILQRKSDKVMNIKQVAEYLGITEGAVHKRCQRGQLPFHKSANKLYFSRLEKA